MDINILTYDFIDVILNKDIPLQGQKLKCNERYRI